MYEFQYRHFIQANFTRLFFLSLFVLPGISPVEAYTESWTINGVCDKKATSGNCYHFSDITRNNAQAYEVSVEGHAEGHGGFGGAGGRVSVAFCLSGSGIAWDGSCMYALRDIRIGNGDYTLGRKKIKSKVTTT